MRPIDADALLEELNELNTYTYTKDINGGKLTFQVWGVGDVGRLITKMPTFERPRGEWINHLYLTEYLYGEYKQCSLCGYEDGNNRTFSYHNFCPNCGAKMRGEGE